MTSTVNPTNFDICLAFSSLFVWYPFECKVGDGHRTKFYSQNKSISATVRRKIYGRDHFYQQHYLDYECNWKKKYPIDKIDLLEMVRNCLSNSTPISTAHGSSITDRLWSGGHGSGLGVWGSRIRHLPKHWSTCLAESHLLAAARFLEILYYCATDTHKQWLEVPKLGLTDLQQRRRTGYIPKMLCYWWYEWIKLKKNSQRLGTDLAVGN